MKSYLLISFYGIVTCMNMVVSEFNLIFFYYRAIFLIVIYAYNNVNVQGARLKINDLRGNDFEVNGLNDFKIPNYQRSNLKAKYLQATNQRTTVDSEVLTTKQLIMYTFRPPYLQSTKGKKGKKKEHRTITPSKLTFPTKPTVVSTFQTISKKKKSMNSKKKKLQYSTTTKKKLKVKTSSTKSKEMLKDKTSKKKKLKVKTSPTISSEIIKDNTRSKKKLKVRTRSTKKITLQTNSKKSKKKHFTTIKTSTKRRFVKKNDDLSKLITESNLEDDGFVLKDEIKTKAINKAMDLFSNSLVKSLSDQLWETFLEKSKKEQTCLPFRNNEDLNTLPEKVVSNVVRNKENSNAPHTERNSKAMQQIEESVERFEIIL